MLLIYARRSNRARALAAATLLLSTLAMKYVALLSGGKDSCYNLLHCSKNGHELVAAASLGPEQGKGSTLSVKLPP